MTALQLTPIGTSPAWYNAGEPCSGFLLDADGFRVLVDCGSGVIARYLALYGPQRPIDAVVLTHVHADHCFDLVPLKYGIEQGTLGHWTPQLWLPPGSRDRLATMASAWDQDFGFFADPYDVRDYAPGSPFEVGPFSVASLAVPHYIECFALRFEHAGIHFGFTADTGPDDRIAPFMSGVDLLLAEAATPQHADLEAPGRGHITGAEAGAIARAAGAHSLLLTHVPEEHGTESTRARASAAFGGPVGLARSGEAYDVAGRLAATG